MIPKGVNELQLIVSLSVHKLVVQLIIDLKWRQNIRGIKSMSSMAVNRN